MYKRNFFKIAFHLSKFCADANHAENSKGNMALTSFFGFKIYKNIFKI